MRSKFLAEVERAFSAKVDRVEYTRGEEYTIAPGRQVKVWRAGDLDRRAVPYTTKKRAFARLVAKKDEHLILATYKETGRGWRRQLVPDWIILATTAAAAPSYIPPSQRQ